MTMLHTNFAKNVVREYACKKLRKISTRCNLLLHMKLGCTNNGALCLNPWIQRAYYVGVTNPIEILQKSCKNPSIRKGVYPTWNTSFGPYLDIIY